MDPQFQVISDELLLLIFDLIATQQSLSNLCFVSRRFCRIATSILYRRISIPPHRVRRPNISPKAPTWYSFESNLIAHTRHITVDFRLDWVVFTSLISKMARLETLRWAYLDEVFPTEIRDVLTEQWPNVEVCIEELPMRSAAASDYTTLRTLNSLFGWQNIRSIVASIDPYCPGPMWRLKETILSCNRLEVLRLHLVRDDDGYLPPSRTPSMQFDLCVKQHDKLPPLKELTIDSRITHDHSTIALIPNTFWNWSQMRRLEIRGQGMCRFLNSIRGQIFYLETLIAEHFCSVVPCDVEPTRILEDFIVSIHGLKSLKLTNHTKQIPVSTLVLHGNTLERLMILHPRRAISPGIDSMAFPYRPQDLDEMREGCPHLMSLALDMEVHSDLPYDFLAALARFPKLEKIRINFRFNGPEYYSNDSDCLPHLKTDVLTVRNMYTYIRSQRFGSPLRLEVVIGHYPRVYTRSEQNAAFDMLRRPIVYFTCFDDEHGNVILEHDALDSECYFWKGTYLDEARLENKPGVTYPSNLEDLMAAEEEANHIMQGLSDVIRQEDTDSLFGP